MRTQSKRTTTTRNWWGNWLFCAIWLNEERLSDRQTLHFGRQTTSWFRPGCWTAERFPQGRGAKTGLWLGTARAFGRAASIPWTGPGHSDTVRRRAVHRKGLLWDTSKRLLHFFLPTIKIMLWFIHINFFRFFYNPGHSQSHCWL